MRLINADELEPVITQWNSGALREESYYHEEQIINAPTVDAVPLKWLASWTKKYIEKTKSEVGVLSEKAVTVAEAFNEMKHDWREENESETIS